jgi:hypothetical protein
MEYAYLTASEDEACMPDAGGMEPAVLLPAVHDGAAHNAPSFEESSMSGLTFTSGFSL